MLTGAIVSNGPARWDQIQSHQSHSRPGVVFTPILQGGKLRQSSLDDNLVLPAAGPEPRGRAAQWVGPVGIPLSGEARHCP